MSKPKEIFLPSLDREIGAVHTINQVKFELDKLLTSFGFEVAEGPEIESEEYNFDMLNITATHPAREMHDTFYVDGMKNVLRTHTSPVQVRCMLEKQGPMAFISPGKVYRKDDDATHLPMFHQIEGLVVDRGISLSDLAGTLNEFTAAYFGGAISSRLRPSYFPFTEPSAEFDITCVICEGAGCQTCQRTGWIELGGCGMVHPNVLANCGVDSEEWTGFAFGFGIDRLALMRYGIKDLRDMYTNDVRFLKQF